MNRASGVRWQGIVYIGNPFACQPGIIGGDAIKSRLFKAFSRLEILVAAMPHKDEQFLAILLDYRRISILY
ncbi:hypothetical protein Herbaro_06880 [Herbaspirillum sp. WKF16]|uniref:hypothetical protein n=1 Tax=Herbaspirillum sp. WKF16 TaxID=3028312 RepID=UPI0023A9E2F5|nr:hypothetical protein [Herbaspirillum sp. WKF16]WDZ97510.1 hypothetical protein Herbaro_06880 [Herbaspirillum sp. WKF16]